MKTRFLLCALGVAVSLQAPAFASFQLDFDLDPAVAGTVVKVFQVTTNAEPGNLCSLSIQTDASNALSGAVYACSNPSKVQTFTPDEVRSNAVLITEDNLNVVTISAPDLDLVHGGTVTVTYLSNGITKSYATWDFELVNTGSSWETTVAANNIQTPFNELYFAKKSFLGKTIGISSITPSWTAP